MITEKATPDSFIALFQNMKEDSELKFADNEGNEGLFVKTNKLNDIDDSYELHVLSRSPVYMGSGAVGKTNDWDHPYSWLVMHGGIGYCGFGKVTSEITHFTIDPNPILTIIKNKYN